MTESYEGTGVKIDFCFRFDQSETTMSFSMIILLFFVINFSVNAQFWNITTTNTGLPVDNDVAVRIYNNYAALLGDSLRFCHYENANVMNCFTRLNSTCRAGDFYADGSDIYFIALGYHDQKIYVYQLSMTVTTPRALLRQNITISDNPKSISIDYHHRWMAVGGKERLHIYDILNPASIRLTSKSTKLSLLSYFTLNSATSMHKNRVCTCEDSINYIRDYGLICFPVSKGILGPATRYQSFVGFMSVKIYNDLIIAGLETTGDIVIFDTSMTLLRFNTDVNYSIFDFSRSGNVIIAADYFAIGNPICFFDISNPKNPVLLASSTFSVDGWPMSLFLAPDALFATSRIGDSSSGNSVHVKVDINFPPGQNWSTFYANSEWNDYGRVKNTLAYHGSIYTLVYGQSDTTFLNFDIADIYLPTGVSITYTVDSVPFDYALEKLQTTWVELTGGEAFQHSDIVSKFIRIRYLNKENPLVRNLNQTITLTADNGRGSQLQFTMPVT